MFNKEEQRRRAQEFAATQLANGVKPPVPSPLPVIPKTVAVVSSIGSNNGWPFTPENAAAARAGTYKEPVTVKKVKTPKKENFDRIPVVNGLGQTLTPGQRAIIVTTGYSHQTKVRIGTYLGVRFNGSRASSYVVEYEADVTLWRHRDGRLNNRWERDCTAERKRMVRRSTIPSLRVYPTV